MLGLGQLTGNIYQNEECVGLRVTQQFLFQDPNLEIFLYKISKIHRQVFLTALFVIIRN